MIRDGDREIEIPGVVFVETAGRVVELSRVGNGEVARTRSECGRGPGTAATIRSVPGPGSELNFWWRVGLALVGPALRLLFDIRWAGMERIPRIGPAILAANHASALDGIVLAYLVARRQGRPTRYLVAAEFFDRPFHGLWLRTFKQIPIRRGGGDAGALDEAVATVRSGALAGIFPEGTVNPDPGGPMLRGRTGVARIALAAGAPMIPVGIWGTQWRWPRAGLTFTRPFRPTVALVFGPPIDPSGDPSSLDDIQATTAVVMTRIGEQTAAARILADRRNARCRSRRADR